MSASQPTSIEDLKIIFKEIVDGYSCSEDGQIFFKHFTDLDNVQIIHQRRIFLAKNIEEGIPSEASRLKEIIANEEWTLEKEDEILSLKMTIADNEKNLASIIIEQQRNVRMMIEQNRKDLFALLVQRAALMGTTAEELTHRDIKNYSLYKACFRDPELSKSMFDSWEDFESVDTPELDRIQEQYDKATEKFQERSIRTLSIIPFFLNTFSYAKDNITLFFGKPLIQLTTLQLFLCSCGQRNMSIISQAETSCPEIAGDITVDDILTWFDQQYSIILGKRNTPK